MRSTTPVAQQRGVVAFTGLPRVDEALGQGPREMEHVGPVKPGAQVHVAPGRLHVPPFTQGLPAEQPVMPQDLLASGASPSCSVQFCPHAQLILVKI